MTLSNKLADTRKISYKASAEEVNINNDKLIIFNLARDLVNAQFFLADPELTKRLWQDVGEKNIEIDRIINLMYNCHFHEDNEAMNEADLSYLNSKGLL